MSTVQCGKISYELLMQNFKKQPCIENARPVFLTCRKHNIPIPANVFDVIGIHLEEAHRKWIKERDQDRISGNKKRLPREEILQCAIESTSLKGAFDLYRNRTGSGDTDGALRKHLGRFLDEELPSLICEYFPFENPPAIPKKLTQKRDLYRKLL